MHKPPLPKVIKAGNKCWGWGCGEGGGVYADSLPRWTARKRHSEPVELPVCPSESWRDMTFQSHHLCWDELSSDDFESFPTPARNPKKNHSFIKSDFEEIVSLICYWFPSWGKIDACFGLPGRFSYMTHSLEALSSIPGTTKKHKTKADYFRHYCAV